MKNPASLLPAFRSLVPLLLSLAAAANNIQVSNVELTTIDQAAGTARVRFDIGWENSWRSAGVPGNWDAAWVFVKFRTVASQPWDVFWQHASLHHDGGHSGPPSCIINTGLRSPGVLFDAVSNPGVGVFIRRSTVGEGTVSYTGVELRWNYGAGNGVSVNSIAEVQVYAIEMVHVPEGPFAAGSGGSETNSFFLTTINTPLASTLSSGVGALGGLGGGHPAGQEPPNADWPNGYRAFYCMKYELSQKAYVDLLNTLTYTQQAANTHYPPGANEGYRVMEGAQSTRNGIAIAASGTGYLGIPAVYACDLAPGGGMNTLLDGMDIPCNLLSGRNAMAYLDWSGLRPLSELEYEKACRGPVLPVANAYAWGDTTIATSPYAMNSAYQTLNEGVTASTFAGNAGNAIYTATNPSLDGQPTFAFLRSGAFAANPANSGRRSAGAGYYGVMELSGNLDEYAVGLHNAVGRSYTGVHGDGVLAPSGLADQPGWPTNTGVSGLTIRGGDRHTPAATLRIADRSGSVPSITHVLLNGSCRGARTAP